MLLLPTSNDFKEFFSSINILKSLTTKNLFGRYRNTTLGFVWHFVTPLMMMGVYYVVLTEVRVTSREDMWVYLTSALFPFNFMISNLTSGASSFINNSGMVKKMFFPRSMIVIAQVLSSFVVLLIGYLIVILIIVMSGFQINYIMLLCLPLILFLTMVFVLGYSLFFSTVTVYVKDIQYVLGSTSIIFFFLTPMYFFMADLSGVLSYVIWLNPFTYFVEVYHQLIYFGDIYDAKYFLICVILSISSLLIGLMTYNRLKGGLAQRL